MIAKIANLTKWKKWFLAIAVILSFALVKSFNVMTGNSTSSMFVGILLILGTGFFYWLVFEVLVGFFYSGLKFKIEPKLNIYQFTNIFRFFIIFFNFFIYFLTKLIIYINFLTNFVLLITYLVFILLLFILIYYVLKKYFLGEIANKQFSLSYFSFAFMYLFLRTIMWGVM